MGSEMCGNNGVNIAAVFHLPTGLPIYSYALLGIQTTGCADSYWRQRALSSHLRRKQSSKMWAKKVLLLLLHLLLVQLDLTLGEAWLSMAVKTSLSVNYYNEKK